jgi:hypothetical protein
MGFPCTIDFPNVINFNIKESCELYCLCFFSGLVVWMCPAFPQILMASESLARGSGSSSLHPEGMDSGSRIPLVYLVFVLAELLEVGGFSQGFVGPDVNPKWLK